MLSMGNATLQASDRTSPRALRVLAIALVAGLVLVWRLGCSSSGRPSRRDLAGLRANLAACLEVSPGAVGEPEYCCGGTITVQLGHGRFVETSPYAAPRIALLLFGGSPDQRLRWRIATTGPLGAGAVRTGLPGIIADLFRIPASRVACTAVFEGRSYCTALVSIQPPPAWCLSDYKVMLDKTTGELASLEPRPSAAGSGAAQR